MYMTYALEEKYLRPFAEAGVEVFSPALYSHRSFKPGGYSTFMSLVDSYHVNGKLWCNENDLQTFRVMDVPNGPVIEAHGREGPPPVFAGCGSSVDPAPPKKGEGARLHGSTRWIMGSSCRVPPLERDYRHERHDTNSPNNRPHPTLGGLF